jgi:hypothetical protein
MARTRITREEKTAGWIILAVLALFCVWLGAARQKLNPAVVAAMNHPKGAARALPGQEASALATLTAGYLLDLTGAAAASGVESYNAETLSDKINGKAELYLASGFEEMSCRVFELRAASDAANPEADYMAAQGADSPEGAYKEPGAPQAAAGPGARPPGSAGGAASPRLAATAKPAQPVRVEVFLYAMASPKDAFAVFSGQRRPGSDQLSIAQNAYATANAVFFTRERFYAELVADKDGHDTRAGLEALAASLLAALPAESAQGLSADRFAAKGLRKESVRLAVSDALGMEGLSNVYTADYATSGGEAGAFLAVRSTPEEARRDAEAYAKFLAANGFKPLAGVKLPPGEGFTAVMGMENMVQVVMSRGSALFGVHDAPDKDAALELAGELARAVSEAKP